MQDPATYILAASAVCFCIGFMASAVICSRRIRRAEIDGWKQGVRFYQSRDREARETPRL